MPLHSDEAPSNRIRHLLVLASYLARKCDTRPRQRALRSLERDRERGFYPHDANVCGLHQASSMADHDLHDIGSGHSPTWRTAKLH